MLYAAVVLAFGLIATPLAIAGLRRSGVVDIPNARSSHARPTVRGAGIGVAAVAEAALIVAAQSGASELLWVAVAAGVYGALGLVDDLWDLSPLVRLPLQLLIATIAVVGVGTIELWILIILGIVAVVGYLNAFNFMDGINGISGLHALGIGVTWMIAGAASDVPNGVLLGGVIAAAALAFLPYNFPRARGFLGDVGSYFFGGCIAMAAVTLYGQLPFWVLVLPLAPYGADTAWTLIRRVRRGETWYEAHREHVYQRLVVGGWSHAQSSLLMGGLTLVCGAAGLLDAYVLEGTVIRIVVFITVLGVLVAYLALPPLLGEPEQQDIEIGGRSGSRT